MQGTSGQGFSAEEIARLVREHPELRLQDDPAIMQLLQMMIADPDDPDLQGLVADLIRDRRIVFLTSNDVWWGHYPPPGILAYPPDFLPLGQMPTGEWIGLVIGQLLRNLGVLGPTGSGKTTLIAVFLSNPQLLQTTRVVVFVKKPELRHLATIPELGGLVTVFRRGDLAFCLMEPPGGVPEGSWTNESVRLIAQCYARFSAQRLLGDIVSGLMTNHPQGVYPTLRQIAETIEAFKPRWGSREAQYRESILWVIKDLLNCTGSIWDYSSSDFLENLFKTPGLAIIELEDLPLEHFAFLATCVMRWVYFRRLYEGNVTL
jgi:hypothetical protein